MEERTRSLQPVIEARYADLTDAGKQAADYFLSLEAEEDLSAKAVAKRIAVSEASLSRFAKSLGFSGYREFIFEYRNCFTAKTAVRQENNRIVLNTYQELLNKIYQVVDEDQLNRLSRKFSESSRIFLAGKGNSGLAAEEIATRFRWLGLDTQFIRDPETMRLQPMFLKKKDLAIGLSISGETVEVLSFLQRAHRNGAFTVLMTGNVRRACENFCDEIIPVPSIEYLSKGSLISPQFPLLIMGDMLYASFAEQNKAVVKRTQEKVQKALHPGK